MKGASTLPSRDGEPRGSQVMQRPVLKRSVTRSKIRCQLIGGSGDTETDHTVNHAVGCRQPTPDGRTTPDVLARLPLTEADSWPYSTVSSRARAQVQSSNGGPTTCGYSEQLQVDSSASVRAGEPPSRHASPSNSFVVEGGEDDNCVKWASATSVVTQPVSEQVPNKWSVSLSTEKRIPRLGYLRSRRPSACRSATASAAYVIGTSAPHYEPLLNCKKPLRERGSNLRGRLSVSAENRTGACSTGCPSVQQRSCFECSFDSRCVSVRHLERRLAPFGSGSGSSLPQGCDAADGPCGVASAVQKCGMLANGAQLNTPHCRTRAISAQGDIAFSIQQRRPLVRCADGVDVVATEAPDVEARRPTERLFSSSAKVGRLTHGKKRSLFSPTAQSPSDKDPPTTEGRGQGRTPSRVASLALVARSCMHRRVSSGTGNGSGTFLQPPRNARKVHHVLFSTHATRRWSFHKTATENGIATEASENGKTASSRTSSSGTNPEKCTDGLAGEYGFQECGTPKVAALPEVEKNELDMRVHAAALGEASVTVFGVSQTESHERRLLHRTDPAKLLRVSCSKCFPDDQARHTRRIEVNRPIVCEEGSSTRYFRKKGEASGAPGSWPAGDSGSTVLSRRLACMLVREVEREARYGFYPVCTRASMMWASVLGSILFLSIGAWLTVEDERHVECRLNYERETLQDGGSRYSLLTITADSCAGRLRTVRLNTTRSDEQRAVQGRSRRAARGGRTVKERVGSAEQEESIDSSRSTAFYGSAGRASHFEGFFPEDLHNGSVRNIVPKKRAMGYSASSSAPLSYFFSLPTPLPQALPQKVEATSVVSELSGPYVYVYVEMENFYQNDAQVLWNRKEEQLAGKIFTDPRDLKECEPAVTTVVNNVTKVLHPCGVLAWSVFTDRFQFLDAVPDDSVDQVPVRPLVLEQSQDVLLNSFGDWRERFKNPPADVRAQYRDRVYFWMSLSDNDDGKDMYKTREEAKAELLTDRLNYEEAGEMVENGHFIQWMHTAPFGRWRKFYGRIRGPIKLPLFAYIAVTYDVKQWRGKKAIVLVQPSRFNGRTQFLGSAYLVFGCILAIVASYMVWRKWFNIPEEKDVDCAQDLRWRTQRKRRVKTRYQQDIHRGKSTT